MYDVALYLHILGLAAVAGGVALSLTTVRRTRIAKTRPEVLSAIGISRVNGVIMPIAAGTLLLTGLYMVSERWSWGSAWIVGGFVLLVVLAVTGGAVVGTRYQALAQALAESPADPIDPELQRRIHDPVLHFAHALNAIMVLVLVFLMTVKPNAVGTVASIVIGVALALVAGFASRRGDEPAPPA
jgi:hypothetical protein